MESGPWFMLKRYILATVILMSLLLKTARIRRFAKYKNLYEQQGDTMMPHFPVLSGYNMDHFKKEYRDALVMNKMLKEFRTGTLPID